MKINIILASLLSSIGATLATNSVPTNMLKTLRHSMLSQVSSSSSSGGWIRGSLVISDDCNKDSETLASDPALQAAGEKYDECIEKTCDQEPVCDVTDCDIEVNTLCMSKGATFHSFYISCTFDDITYVRSGIGWCFASSCTDSDIDEVFKEHLPDDCIIGL